MRLGATVLALSLAAGAACDGASGSSCSDTVATPGGVVARQCVHEVPNGAVVADDGDGGVTVTVDGEIVATYPPCPCKNAGIGAPPPPAPSDASTQ